MEPTKALVTLFSNPFFLGMVSIGIIVFVSLCRTILTHDSNPDHWRIRYEELDRAYRMLLGTRFGEEDEEEEEDDYAGKHDVC